MGDVNSTFVPTNGTKRLSLVARMMVPLGKVGARLWKTFLAEFCIVKPPTQRLYTLIGVNGLNGNGLVTGNLGTMSFSTGALTSGSLGGPTATFAAGGSFTITGNGTNGIPNGVIFNGSFSSPVSWTRFDLPNGTHNYTLSGVISGSLGGFSTDGVSIQLTINTGLGLFNGSTTLASGDTNVVVPEPGTLGLLGTGLVGIAGLVRRRLKIG